MTGNRGEIVPLGDCPKRLEADASQFPGIVDVGGRISLLVSDAVATETTSPHRSKGDERIPRVTARYVGGLLDLSDFCPTGRQAADLVVAGWSPRTARTVPS